MNSALLLIDIQNIQLELLKAQGFENACGNARKILEEFRKTDLPVFHVMHAARIPALEKIMPPEKIAHLVQINEMVKPAQGEAVVKKTEINCFKGTELLDLLKKQNIEKLVICGMMTHICVDAAVRAGHDLGFEILVIHDACATIDLEFNGDKVAAKDVNTAMFAAFGFAYAKLAGTDEFTKNFKKFT